MSQNEGLDPNFSDTAGDSGLRVGKAVPASTVLLEPLRHDERLLCRVRFVATALVLAMAGALDPASRVAAIALAGSLAVANAGLDRRLSRVTSAELLAVLGQWALRADVFAAAVSFALFLFDPSAMPAAFAVFLVFEFSLRFGTAGTVPALVGFTGAVVVRAYVEARFLPGREVRLPMLFGDLTAAVVLAVLAQELRQSEAGRAAAERRQERVSAEFRHVVESVLDAPGVPLHRAARGEVLEALSQLCEQDSEECGASVDRIVGALSQSWAAAALTLREKEVLALLAKGYSSARIGATLHLSASTVRSHIQNMRTKLGLASREELAALGHDPADLATRRYG